MTAIIDRGIRRLDHPCWTIVTHDGRPAGFEESELHFLTEQEATDEIPHFPPTDDVRVIQLDTRCLVAFLHCGEQFVYESDDGPSAHFADETGLLDAIAVSGLLAVEENVFACDRQECETCTPFWLASRREGVADAMVDAARLALRFGRVERITFHPDAERPETDTDHTVMLALIACSLAQKLYPHLDQGRIAALALVHDLPEVYAGDTPTLRLLTDGQAADKKRREADAVKRIRAEFAGTLPWISTAVAVYEQQNLPEARFVRAVDKLMPKLTHVLNNARTARTGGVTAGELTERYVQQREEIAGYAGDFPELLELHRVLAGRVLGLLTDEA